MTYRFLQSLPALVFLAMLSACKDKEAPAVIEEVPSSATAPETDTSATLAEEPSLSQIGKDAVPGSAKNTFHPSASAEKAGFTETGRYVVQVAIFKSKRQAANLVEKLANSGYPAYVAEVENPVPDLYGTYHRVRIGRFRTISDARAFGDNTLKPNGYDFWVDNKRNDAVGGEGGSYSSPASPETPPSYESVPREPAMPSSESWDAPKAVESAPPTPSGNSWDEPATTIPPAATPSTLPSEPATPTADTGRINLDEW